MVKLYPPIIRSDFASETEVRAALHACGSAVPFPRILASGVLQDRLEWAYIIEEFRPGQATRDVWGSLDRADRDSLSAQVACILRDLHSTPLSLLPTLQLSAADWREQARGRARACADEISAAEMLPGARLPDSLIGDVRRFMDARVGRLIGSVGEGSLRLLHSDMTEDHVLVERSGIDENPWHITALIDYGDAKVGPPEEEWVVLWVGLLMQDPVAMRAFFRSYGQGTQGKEVDPACPAFREAVLAFTLLHRFNWAIIREVVRRAGVHPSSLTSLESLEGIMWPPA